MIVLQIKICLEQNQHVPGAKILDSGTKSESRTNKEEERKIGNMRELSSHPLPHPIAVFPNHISLRHPDHQNAWNRNNNGTLEQCVFI